jgi:mitochondrial fission protein ELM1
VLDVSPSLIDLEQLSTAANNFLMSKKIAQDELYWVMLIGGEGSGYSYKKSDIRTLVDGMLLLAKKYQINWLLTTSRRLGKSNEDYLKGLLSGEKSISYAVYYIAKPEKVMNAFLGLGDIIFCTEDSTSMINEAVTTQKPVVTLRARTQGINRGHQDVITRFENNGHIERIKIDELHQFSPQSVQFNPINIEKGYDKVIRLIEQEVIGR